ncbi:hypothetical protein CC_3608 [Caulobacter vibrioides CB15]|uniref:Uncharacterized protein n=1 Tax=Caulobacter vibrioides (strain ATCC 19089 / CIP 103742 / CB 15) TaxID=190650 RepID=Q9A2F7_CAUVC|nr:hypothetical protein CC_3608 [Caulobacter vibrioides CB15]
MGAAVCAPCRGSADLGDLGARAALQFASHAPRGFPGCHGRQCDGPVAGREPGAGRRAGGRAGDGVADARLSGLGASGAMARVRHRLHQAGSVDLFRRGDGARRRRPGGAGAGELQGARAQGGRLNQNRSQGSKTKYLEPWRRWSVSASDRGQARS